MPAKLLLVGIGGALGSICRFCLSLGLQKSGGFPYGTLAANVLGCLLIGLVAGMLDPQQQLWRCLVIGGFLGGFTTFSAFGYETILLAQSEQLRLALLNFVAQLGLGGLAVLAGLALARTISS